MNISDKKMRRNEAGKKIKGTEGFALMEVLVLILVILIFLTSLFSSARFRHQVEVLRVEKMEASYEARAAVELMVNEILSGGTCSLEDGLERTKTELVFEPMDGSDIIRRPVWVWTERREDELFVYAERVIGDHSEIASVRLVRGDDQLTATTSNVGVMSGSNAKQVSGADVHGVWSMSDGRMDTDE